MTSFRANKKDLVNINKIILARGGISKTDAIRVALHEAATNEPKLVIKPQIAPIHEVEKTIATLNRFAKEWGDANRCGWPEHISGESAERTDKVIMARSRNEAAFAEFAPRLEQMRLLLKSVMTCKEFDVNKLKNSLDFIHKRYKLYVEELKKPGLPQNTINLYAKVAQSYRCILDFFSAVGVIAKITP